MTVGIAAICEAHTPNPKVVVAADRLVTSGLAARREYEHTSSKMLDVYGQEGGSSCVALGVGAGSVSLTDEVFYKINQQVSDSAPGTARQVADYAVDSLQEVVQETIERQVLSAQGLDLTTFNQIQGQMNPNVATGIYQDIIQKKEETLGQVNILLAGVDGNGAHIYNILNNDMSRNHSIGKLAVGSGAQPANTTFIITRYVDTCDIGEALLSVTEAKVQAEEAQGVGREMDIAILHEGGRDNLADDDLTELREIYDEVVEAEREARSDTIQENNYTFSL
jgi:20S proteasome alpha/beta subunit